MSTKRLSKDSVSRNKKRSGTVIATFDTVDDDESCDELISDEDDIKNFNDVSIADIIPSISKKVITEIELLLDTVTTDVVPIQMTILNGACATQSDVLYHLSQTDLLQREILRIRDILNNNDGRITHHQLELDGPCNYIYNAKEQTLLDNSRITEIEQDCTPVICHICRNSMLVRREPPPTRRADEGTTITYRCNRMRDHPSGRVIEWAVKG